MIAPRVEADRDVCIGSGVCVMYAPGTFTQDGEAKVVVLTRPSDGPDEIRIAVGACPTSALTLVNEEAP